MITPELEGAVTEALRDALARIQAVVSGASVAACPVPDRDRMNRAGSAANQG